MNGLIDGFRAEGANDGRTGQTLDLVTTSTEAELNLKRLFRVLFYKVERGTGVEHLRDHNFRTKKAGFSQPMTSGKKQR